MLVLSRKPGEKILIGDDIEIMVSSVHKNSVKLSIDAPKHVKVDREEIRRSKECDDENSRD